MRHRGRDKGGGKGGGKGGAGGGQPSGKKGRLVPVLSSREIKETEKEVQPG